MNEAEALEGLYDLALWACVFISVSMAIIAAALVSMAIHQK